MFKVKKYLSIPFILILMLVFMTACDSSLQLNFKVKKGDKYTVTQNTEQKTTMSASGQTKDIIQNTELTYSFNITDVDKDGLATVVVKYETIKVRSSGSGTDLEYDSTKENSQKNPMNTAYAPMIGQEFKLQIDKEGKVQNVEGLDSLIDRLADRMDIPNQNLKQSIVGSMKQLIGDDVLKGTFSQMTDIYPGKKIKVGDTWENSQTLNAGFPMTINSIWTLQEEKGDNITLFITSLIDSDSSAKDVSLMGFSVKYKFSGEQKGTFKLSKSNGLTQHGELNQKIEGSMELNDGGSLLKGVAIPIKVESKTIFEMKKSK